jgi:hypothetical protein
LDCERGGQRVGESLRLVGESGDRRKAEPLTLGGTSQPCDIARYLAAEGRSLCPLPGAADRRLASPTRTEALKLAGAEVLDDTESGLIEAATPADAIDAIFAPWRQVLVESNFTMGCPLAATVVDACGEDRLRQEARALLDQWRDSVYAALVKFGVQESTAEDDASVLLAALEGALILSRANQSTQPLDTVQRFFTTSLTKAAANPAMVCAMVFRRLAADSRRSAVYQLEVAASGTATALQGLCCQPKRARQDSNL